MILGENETKEEMYDRIICKSSHIHDITIDEILTLQKIYDTDIYYVRSRFDKNKGFWRTRIRFVKCSPYASSIAINKSTALFKLMCKLGRLLQTLPSGSFEYCSRKDGDKLNDHPDNLEVLLTTPTLFCKIIFKRTVPCYEFDITDGELSIIENIYGDKIISLYTRLDRCNRYRTTISFKKRDSLKIKRISRPTAIWRIEAKIGRMLKTSSLDGNETCIHIDGNVLNNDPSNLQVSSTIPITVNYITPAKTFCNHNLMVVADKKE